MSSLIGKQARKKFGGNRFTLKRARREVKRTTKEFYNKILTKEDYQKIKALKKK